MCIRDRLRTSSPEDLTEELKEELTTEELTTEELTTEELMTGSTIQLKEHIPLTSDIATDSEEELRAGDSGSDYDDIRDLMGEIDSITRDDAKGTYFHEPGGDEGSYLTGSSWGHAPNITNITMWTSFDMGAITDFVIDSEDLASLLSSSSDGGPVYYTHLTLPTIDSV